MGRKLLPMLLGYGSTFPHARCSLHKRQDTPGLKCFLGLFDGLFGCRSVSTLDFGNDVASCWVMELEEMGLVVAGILEFGNIIVLWDRIWSCSLLRDLRIHLAR